MESTNKPFRILLFNPFRRNQNIQFRFTPFFLLISDFFFLGADDKLFLFFAVFLRCVWEKTYLHMDLVLLNVLWTVGFWTYGLCIKKKKLGSKLFSDLVMKLPSSVPLCTDVEFHSVLLSDWSRLKPKKRKWVALLPASTWGIWHLFLTCFLCPSSERVGQKVFTVPLSTGIWGIWLLVTLAGEDPLHIKQYLMKFSTLLLNLGF